jgi:lipoprotein-releasing system permease protein
MNSAYELWLAVRHLGATRHRGFISFVALVSAIGLMLGVATLIVVLSVMNGFERELRERILNVTAHATLTGLDGLLADWRTLQQRTQQSPRVKVAVPFIESEAMVAHQQRVMGAKVRGIEPQEEARATELAQRLKKGRLSDLRAGRYGTVLGSALAQELAVDLGDAVVLMAPQGAATPSGVMPRMRRFTVVGIFESGMYEFDRGLALVHMSDAAKLFRTGSNVTGMRFVLDDPLQAPQVARQLAVDLGGGFYVTDWTYKHVNFFRSIEMTKSMLFVILLLIVAVAAFNIVATLVMIVKDKQSDIAILRTLGAGPRNILATFNVQGILIGLAGTFFGALLGIVLANNLQTLVSLLERALHTQFLDARVYYMSDLPAYVEWFDVLLVCSVSFLLCAIATLYPALRAARMPPAEALRRD